MWRRKSPTRSPGLRSAPRLAKEETGYSQEQGTRPQTLGVAMSDSPVGVAAWILEKFGAWADVPRDAHCRPDLWQAFDEDLLLTNIMLYLVEGSFVTSTWMYRGRVLEGSGNFPAGTRIAVPTGIAAFPDPVFPPPPRSQAEKTYDIVQWTEMPAGGHFAALEQPDLLLADMRRFSRPDRFPMTPRNALSYFARPGSSLRRWQQLRSTPARRPGGSSRTCQRTAVSSTSRARGSTMSIAVPGRPSS
ncbi:hypothetical protein QP162_10365 [Sphingomonas aurantiaca]|uniref:hypothetical protein n=1 Tax=Sphingomonas aurantiaca TaxID=185949 RepID=UPI002FE3BACF